MKHVWLLVPFLTLASLAKAADQPVVFERDVRPILKTHCFQCHGEAGKKEGGLDLRLRRWIVKGGESGPAVVPGKAGASRLVRRISAGEMPPGKEKLNKADVALIAKWVAAGAKTARAEPKTLDDKPFITPEERRFWSFQPIHRPAIPRVKRGEQAATPVDAFLLRKLESHGVGFSPVAGRRTLIRRLTFDLHGVPPTPEEIAAFVGDARPGAYARLVDRLLSSPRYGERWGRHWLDVAGYADSEGYTNADTVRKWSYKYRDYVIRAINGDKPFDAFVREQLAGDELVPQPHRNLTREQTEKLIATGFLRMAPDGTGSGGVNQSEARNAVLAETIKIVSTSLLGMTVGCAQCHDHRYDPIPQVDYYRFRAIFEPAYDPKHWKPPAQRRISLYRKPDRAAAKRIEAEAAKLDAQRLKKQQAFIERTFQKELAKLPVEMRDIVANARNTPAGKRTAAQKALIRKHPSVNVTAGSLYLYDRKAANELKAIAAKAAGLRATKPVEQFIRVLTEQPGHVPQTRLFFRGDYRQPRQAVQPGGLTVVDLNGKVRSKSFDREPAPLPKSKTSGRRLAFARRLTGGRHPLLARVIVNRVWMHHFGRGIVNTPADFGRLGERPSHPELLDWLAAEFMTDWSLKRLHRLILLSRAFRQTSTRRSDLENADPDNRLFGRMLIRRLDAESLRDSLLALGGRFNQKMYGEPVPVMEDAVGRFVVGKENKNGENRPGKVISLNGEEFRRSLYVQVRRTRPLAVLSTFDAPRMEPNCKRRTSSTVTPQALMLMNDDFVVVRSREMAARLHRECGTDPAKQIRRAWELAYGRLPSAEELTASTRFLDAQKRQFSYGKKAGKKAKQPDPATLALGSFCQALMSSNGFLYVD
ncbi:MAG: PSD1 and planctomycete cytochrome C domain-containing protein [Planctomycetaceae bacterium]